MTIPDKLRQVQIHLKNTSGTGPYVGWLQQAITALERGLDVEDLLQERDRLIAERDEANKRLTAYVNSSLEK